MKKTLTYIIIAAFLLSFSTAIHAEVPQWKIDPAHTGIYFSIDHIFSKVKGYFGEFDGRIEFDPDNLEKSGFDFTVKVKSINTNNSKRDNHLQSDDFFSVKNYPDIRFKSSSITHNGDNQYSVTGTLNMKDVSREIELPLTFFGTKTHPFDPKQEVAGFETNITIDRFDYNVGNGKFLKLGVVGKEVDVFVTIEATRNK